jgi:hypothetical protein
MNRGNEYRTECGLMEYSEQVIYELQSILRDKVGDDRLPVIKKAMDIEDYLYRDALYKSGLDLTGNVWESSSAVNTYIESMENVKKLIKAKEDFGKLYPIADTRQFYLQLTSQRTTTNKKKVSYFFDFFFNEKIGSWRSISRCWEKGKGKTTKQTIPACCQEKVKRSKSQISSCNSCSSIIRISSSGISVPSRDNSPNPETRPSTSHDEREY